MSLIRRTAPVGWFLMAVLSAIVLTLCAGAYFFVTIPDAADLKGCLTTRMFSIHLCKDDPNYVPLKLISPFMRNAVIVSEDAAFWDHRGIDWIELRKSLETNIAKGRMARGGSTITQQLAKNVYLTSEKSLLRKVREAVIALRIERLFEKNEILEKYLNVVEFGVGIYGIKPAAKHYFGVTPASLSIAQAAWLAFLLPSPEKYSISFRGNKLTPFAFRQMSEIINRLGRFKRISEEQRQAAIVEARAFFGGLSGESKELEEEFDRENDETSVDTETSETDDPETVEPELALPETDATVSE